MKNNFWYNQVMPAEFEKKDVPLPMKVPASLKKTIELVANDQDRPVGYVARELMKRGLELYNKDGLLKSPNPTKKVSQEGVTVINPKNSKKNKEKDVA